MYSNVSQEWLLAQSGEFAPEGFISIECYIPELGKSLTFTKKDLLKFVHRQTVSLLSAELPKNHIEFSLDNSDDKWNPSNPNGLYRYLSERLKITVKYGFLLHDVVEWIPGGTFYLTEWGTTQNGYEATFVARDILEYMIDAPYTGLVTGTLHDLILAATNEVDLSNGNGIEIDNVLAQYSLGVVDPKEKHSIAQIWQKSANAAQCVMYQNRDGRLTVSRLNKEPTRYVIPLRLSYSYPQIEFSRPLRAIEVTYVGDKKVTYNVGISGETQTLQNDFISDSLHAKEVAVWVEDNLRSRRKIRGEFRGDPRVDVLDVVTVETKYGPIERVILTDIKISFTGTFAISFEGYINHVVTAVDYYCGELYAGEVI